MPGVLEGVTVLEMGQAIAIPSGAAMLADWGANVIKIEPLHGELTRGTRVTHGVPVYIQYPNGEVSYYFEQLNRGKKGIALDLSKPGAHAIVHRLVASADIFLTNYEQRALKKLCVDYASLRSVNPKLVYAALSGYGSVGPDKDERGYDYTASWARSGIQYILGRSGEPPMQPPGQGDNTAGAHVIAGVLAAVLHAQRTGIGQELEFSLFHSAVWTINLDIVASLAGRPFPKGDRTNVANPLLNTYRTRDDRWLQLAMLQPDAHWADFCQVIERPELENDPRFNSLPARMEHRRALIAIIEDVMATRAIADWEPILRAHKCIYSRVQSPAEVVTDPQALENDYFVELDHPAGGPVKVVSSPAKFSATPAGVADVAPQLGQHTEEILLDLGYSWEDIASFGEQGVIR